MQYKNIFIKILLVVFVFGALTIQAQKKTLKIKYTSTNNFQTFIGSENTGIGLETIHGIKLKQNWSVGVGAAMDIYQMVSVPIFVDIRKSFGNKSVIPFAYANAGLNINLHNAQYPKYQNELETYQFKNSYYSALGIGIKRKISSSAHFLFSFGISAKQFKYHYNNPWFIGQENFNPDYQYNFIFKRYSCKIGIEF